MYQQTSLSLNEPTEFSYSNMLGSNGAVLELIKGDKLRVVSGSNNLDYVVFMITQYPKQENNNMDKTRTQAQNIDGEDEEIVTYTAKESGYHTIYCICTLWQSGIWIDTYAKKNGIMITDQFSTSTNTYVYDFGANTNASFGGPSASSYIYLEEGDTFSLHCDETQALDYVTASVSVELNGSKLKNTYLLQKTGENIWF